MTAPQCVTGCGRPAPDGYACPRCSAKARGHLAEIADTIGAARDVARGLSSTGSDVGASGVPESTVPLNLPAAARLDSVTGELLALARMIGEERGLPVADVSHWDDPIEGLAVRLAEHLEWLRHHPAADEHLGVIAACARVVRSIVRGPVELRYLGPCGAPMITIAPEVAAEQGIDPANAARGLAPCDGDVYGRPGADAGRCRTCGAEVDQAERRAWLDELTAELAAPARDIAHSLDLPVKTIRSWANEIVTETGHVVRRAKLRTYYRAGEHVVPWTERPKGMTDQAWKAETERRGLRLHYVGDVRRLAEEAAARRTEREAHRNREGAAA